MSILTAVLNVLFGLFSGVFGGLGMGGGTLLIPLLTIFLGFEQKLAQGINLMSFLVMAIISLFIHYRNGYLHTKNLYLIIVPGICSSFAGAFVANALPTEILRMFFGGFLCILSIFQFIKAIKG